MNTKHPVRLRHWIKITAILIVIGAVSAVSSANVRGAVRDTPVTSWVPALAKLALDPITEFMQGPVAGQGDGRTVPGAQAKPGAPAQPPAGDGMVSLLVKTRPGLSDEAVDAMATRAGGKRGRGIGALRLHVIQVPQAALEGVMHRFQEDADVERVEVEQRRQIAQDAVAPAPPNDPGHADQWALDKIRWNAAWSSVTPIGSARIAVIDTGVSPAGGDINVDAGWSAFGTDPKVDANGHGTWVASIAAAIGNNSKGVAGVSFANTSVLPVQVLDANGLGQDSDIISGVLWAVENKADVILMAFSNPGYSQSLQDAIDLAWANGIVIVAAAGNEASSMPTFPAGDSKVVGVSATDQNDALWSQSNFGKGAFLAAPGVAASGLRPDGSILTTSGTSASSAIVAGAAALLKIADPSATNGVIVGRLARNADVAGTQEQTGNGRLNVQRALADASLDAVVPVGAPPEGDGGPLVGPYRSAAKGLEIVFAGTGSGTVSFSAFNPGPDPTACTSSCSRQVDNQQLGTLTVTPNAGSTFTWSGTFETPGSTTCSGTTNSCNFSMGNKAQVLTVTFNGKSNQSVAFDAVADRTYGDAPFTVSATASSNLSVAFASTTSSVCTVSGSTVTIVAAGSCTVRASQPGNASYNFAPDVDRSFTVARKLLTGVFTASDKSYDGTTSATILTRAVSGVIAQDSANVTFTGGTATFDTVGVATGKTVTLTGAALGGSAASNYTLGTTASWTTTASITAKQLTAAFTADNKPYDGTTAATVLTRTVTGMLAADAGNVSFTGGTAAFDNANVGMAKTVTLTGATLGGSASGNYSLGTATSWTATANITAKQVTPSFTADNKAYDGTTAATVLTRTVAGVLPADTENVNFTGGTAAFDTASVGTGKTVTLTGATLDGSAAGNYSLVAAPSWTATANVTPRAVTITADAKTKTYGEADPGLTYQLTSGTLVAPDALTGALSRAAGEPVGSYAIQQGTVALSANYTLTFVGANLTISKRAVTITADAKTKIYGESDPALTYQVTAGSLAGSDAFAGRLARAGGDVVGSYAIQQGTVALSDNYDLTFTGANLTISKRAVTITADAKNKVYGEVDPALSYQVTTGSLAGSDAFAGSLTRAAGEPVGAYAITQGSVALSDNYTLTFAGADLTITKRAVTITADVKTKVYGEVDPALTYQTTAGSLVTGDAFTGALTRAVGESVGAYAIQQGSLALDGNYTMTYAGANLTITPRAITVTADPKTKVYSNEDPALSFQITAGNLLGTDSFTGGLTRDSGVDVGIYAIAQGTLALSMNYTLTFVGANLTITPAAGTIVLTDLLQASGGALKPTAATSPVGLPVLLKYYQNDVLVGTGSVTAVGVYKVVANFGTANYTGSTTDIFVIFDPTGGFVTGGGWIESPVGACNLTPACASMTGRANFGFVSKYEKGAKIPTGQTQFQFQAGGLNFHSTAYEWLVVAGARAQYKGTGTVNGDAGYQFLLTALDAQVNGGGGQDSFRIKITKDGQTIYDNQPDTLDDAPLGGGTALVSGSIVIHQPPAGKK